MRKISKEERQRLDTDDRYLLETIQNEISRRLDSEGERTDPEDFDLCVEIEEHIIESFIEILKEPERQVKVKLAVPVPLKGF
jgi:hypothetical protein